VIEDEVLKITTYAHSKGKIEVKTYQVADLIVPVENYALPASASLSKVLDQRMQQGSGMPATSAPMSPVNGISGGANVSQSSGSQGSQQASVPVTDAGSPTTIQDKLIALIKNSIKPESWDDMGGAGHIDYYPIGLALIVNQTPDIQEQVAELLQALRRLQDQEVTVEVKFISVAEGFFERIGIDFNVNIPTKNTPNSQALLTSGQHQQVGNVNNFNPSNFLSGLIPGGTGPGNQSFTSDLNIPITNSSFGAAIPPFGGFPNIPGANGGISLGLAFLSDIQVFLFMEAAQGDQRTNVMQ